MVVVTISGYMMSLAAWQVGHQQAVQSDQESRWAAISAINIGIQKFLSVSDPSQIAARPDIPLAANSSTVPTSARWQATPNRTTSMRWWAETIPIDPTTIIIHGEGRSGGQVTSISSYQMTLTFDYSRRMWIPGSTLRPWEPSITSGVQ